MLLEKDPHVRSSEPVRWTVLGAVVGVLSGIGFALWLAGETAQAMSDFGVAADTSEVLSWHLEPNRLTTWLVVAGAAVVAAINQGLLLRWLVKRIGVLAIVVVFVLDVLVGAVALGWILSPFASASRLYARSIWPPIAAAAAAHLSLVLGLLVITEVSVGTPPAWLRHGWLAGLSSAAVIVATTGYLLTRLSAHARRPTCWRSGCRCRCSSRSPTEHG